MIRLLALLLLPLPALAGTIGPYDDTPVDLCAPPDLDRVRTQTASEAEAQDVFRSQMIVWRDNCAPELAVMDLDWLRAAWGHQTGPVLAWDRRSLAPVPVSRAQAQTVAPVVRAASYSIGGSSVSVGGSSRTTTRTSTATTHVTVVHNHPPGQPCSPACPCQGCGGVTPPPVNPPAPVPVPGGLPLLGLGLGIMTAARWVRTSTTGGSL